MIEFNCKSLKIKENKILGNLSFNVKKNEFVKVIGSNGSGKSTISYLLTGIIPNLLNGDFVGTIKLEGKPMLLMQNPSTQFLTMSVSEELKGIPLEKLKKFVSNALLERSVFSLSLGEKQKINLLSTLFFDYDIILLDEPLELLDPFEKGRFIEVIKSFIGKKTIIWFDKDVDETINFGRLIYLNKKTSDKIKKDKNIFSIPKKSKALGNTILKTDFSTKDAILESIKLSIKQGEKIAIIGANGSGKTTLIKCLAGINKFSGSVETNSSFSYSPQDPTHLFFEGDVNEEANQEFLSILGLDKLKDKDPNELSKGFQKMLSIAKAFNKNSDIILLDEPTTWLDKENCKKVLDLLIKTKSTVILSTHKKDILEVCDRIFMLKAGGLTQCSNTSLTRFFQG